MEENTNVATDTLDATNTTVESASDLKEIRSNAEEDANPVEGVLDLSDAESVEQIAELDVEENAVLDESEMSETTLAKYQHEKKKKKRAEKRAANLMLRSHFEQPEPEPEPDLDDEQDEDFEADTEQQLDTYVRKSFEAEQERKTGTLVSRLGTVDRQDADVSPQLSSSDEIEYRQKSLKTSFKVDFLNYFVFPSLSDISTESSELRFSTRRTFDKELDITQIDQGHFVDPLTGEIIVSEMDMVEEAQEEDESTPEEEESFSISFDWPYPLEDEPPPVVKMIDDTEAVMEMLMDTRASIGVQKVVSTTKMEAQRLEQDTRRIVIDFVLKTIDEAVEAAEYVDPDTVLRAKLDKSKLISDLHNMLGDCLSAKQYNTDLTNKMFDYYRRLGQLRCFDVLPPQINKIEFMRQRDALHLLDHFRARVAETKRINNLLMATVYMDLYHVQTITLTTAESLENCIRETLMRKDRDFLPRVVDHDLRRMQIMRNEISDSRLWLITRHHTLGRLIERKLKFDQITPELTMDQFLNAQRDVTALGTKVEERNHDLTRMRDRCTKHVHQLAFIREKTSMTSAALTTHKYVLQDQAIRQENLRNQLLKLKLQHAHLKAQKIELQEKSGLVHRTALLYDYDETVKVIKTKTERVLRLRNIVVDLEARIALFELHRLSSVFSIHQKNQKKSKIRYR